MVVVAALWYSLMVGLSSLEMLTAIRGYSLAISSLIVLSWDGFLKDQSRQTEMASTPALASSSTALAASSRSRGTTTSPIASTLSVTPLISGLGTRGAGLSSRA